MLILSLARGGLVNTYYGNLDLLSNEQGSWFAKVQALFFGLQTYGRFAAFGGMPGNGQPYGYTAEGPSGALFTVVNPAQSMEAVRLPVEAEGRILFHDCGHVPVLRDGYLTLGSEQMAVVGTGCYNDSSFDLGRQYDIRIPLSIKPLSCEFRKVTTKEIATTLIPPEQGCVRVVMRQFEQNGKARRSSGGSPPNGITLGKILCIEADQGGKPVGLQINYDKAIWSGLSCAVGEFSVNTLLSGAAVNIRCFTKEPADVILKAGIYHTVYADV